MKRSWIETFSESLGLIPKISDRPDWSEEFAMEGPRTLYKYPSPNEWDDFVELDPLAWPRKEERHYSIVPTTCFNCDCNNVRKKKIITWRSRSMLTIFKLHFSADPTH